MSARSSASPSLMPFLIRSRHADADTHTPRHAKRQEAGSLDARRPRRRGPPEAGRLDHRPDLLHRHLHVSPTPRPSSISSSRSSPARNTAATATPARKCVERKLAALEGGEDGGAVRQRHGGHRRAADGQAQRRRRGGVLRRVLPPQPRVLREAPGSVRRGHAPGDGLRLRGAWRRPSTRGPSC